MSMGITAAFAARTVDVGGGDGSISLENGTTGVTYQLYKVFDATYSTSGTTTNVAYTFTKTEANTEFYNALTASGSPFTLTETATTGKYTVVKKDVQDSALFTWVENNVKGKDYLKVGAEITLAETDAQAIEWTNLAYGYYMITSSLDDYEDGKSYVTIDSNVPDATVIDKNQKPSFDKNIVLVPATPATTETEAKDAVLNKVNEAGLAEDVDFDITVNSKNYDGKDKIFKYVIYDTLDNGWTLKEAPVVTIAGSTKTAGTDYTITYKDKEGAATTTLAKAQYFEITIDWTKDGTIGTDHNYKANDIINVTYTAFLDPDKSADVNVGATPNKNEADVQYFKGDNTTTTPNGDLPNVVTNTFDTSITIIKTDGSAALTGAEFQLTSEDGTQVAIVTGQEYVKDAAGTYYKLKDGTYTTEVPTGEAEHDAAYENTEEKYKLQNVANVIDGTAQGTDLKAFVGEDGKLTFSGLGVGTYTLVETTVPEGYNKADDITFTISFTPDYTNKTGKFASDNTNVKLTGETTNVFDTTVVNQAGTVLPSTGGIGTTIFYVVGSILVVAAGVLLITKKRMSREG